VTTFVVKDPPEHGDGVRALQHLLHIPESGMYDQATANAVYRKKLELGYQTPDHNAGDLLTGYLQGTKRPTAAMVKRAAAYRASLARAGSTARPATKQATAAEKAKATEAAIRGRAVSLMHLLIANNPRIHYPAGDKRTMTIHDIATMEQLQQQINGGRLTIDCSQSVTLIAHVAGAKDPNGGNWKSDGYTGTLLDGCQHITKSQIQAGDMCVFGGGTGHHVCMVMQVGNDPLLFSHGQENDPIAISQSVEARYQPPGLTYLRLPT
jgi:hypothetical protein